jgi:hemerythrin
VTSAERQTEPLPWNDSFSVGHRELDAEHRRMVDLINQICIASHAIKLPRQHTRLLRKLENLTEIHFEHEEAVLETLYTAMPEDRLTLREMLADSKDGHGAEHRKMLGDLADIRKMRLPPPDAVVAGSKLCDELRAWFVDHAIGYEAQIKTILQSV